MHSRSRFEELRTCPASFLAALAIWVIVLTFANVARGDTTYKVGVTTRDFAPAEPYDWRASKARALHTVIWYPTDANARAEAQWIGPPIIPFFNAGSAAPDAPPSVGARRPLILLSHGNGGSGLGLAWIGSALAAHGYVVAAVDHPGNNSNDGTTVEGFALFWLRAVDLRAVLDAILADKVFGDLIDLSRIGAAGHSFGGYTVIAAAGGIAEPSLLETFCRSPEADSLCTQPGLSELRNQRMARLSSDPDFRQRYNDSSKSYLDKRIRAVLAMAPGPGPVFTPNSLRDIAIPISIVAGSADDVTPSRTGAEALAKAIPNASLKLFPGAGHFVFLNTCTRMGRLLLRVPCGDPSGVRRQNVHADTIKLAIAFFVAHLR